MRDGGQGIGLGRGTFEQLTNRLEFLNHSNQERVWQDAVNLQKSGQAHLQRRSHSRSNQHDHRLTDVHTAAFGPKSSRIMSSFSHEVRIAVIRIHSLYACSPHDSLTDGLHLRPGRLDIYINPSSPRAPSTLFVLEFTHIQQYRSTTFN